VVFDRHVLALDVAGFSKPLAERWQTLRSGIGRPDVFEPDHRRRLLRQRLMSYLITTNNATAAARY
jgi:hypothetical protein